MDQVHTQSSLAKDIEEKTGIAQTWHSNVNFTTRMMVERCVYKNTLTLACIHTHERSVLHDG